MCLPHGGSRPQCSWLAGSTGERCCGRLVVGGFLSRDDGASVWPEGIGRQAGLEFWAPWTLREAGMDDTVSASRVRVGLMFSVGVSRTCHRWARHAPRRHSQSAPGWGGPCGGSCRRSSGCGHRQGAGKWRSPGWTSHRNRQRPRISREVNPEPVPSPEPWETKKRREPVLVGQFPSSARDKVSDLLADGGAASGVPTGSIFPACDELRQAPGRTSS